MRLAVLCLVVLALVAISIDVVRRRRDRRHRPTYVQDLQRWAAMESEIKPMVLPYVKPLKGVKVSELRSDNVARFDRRIGESR